MVHYTFSLRVGNKSRYRPVREICDMTLQICDLIMQHFEDNLVAGHQFEILRIQLYKRTMHEYFREMRKIAYRPTFERLQEVEVESIHLMEPSTNISPNRAGENPVNEYNVLFHTNMESITNVNLYLLIKVIEATTFFMALSIRSRTQDLIELDATTSFANHMQAIIDYLEKVMTQLPSLREITKPVNRPVFSMKVNIN